MRVNPGGFLLNMRLGAPAHLLALANTTTPPPATLYLDGKQVPLLRVETGSQVSNYTFVVVDGAATRGDGRFAVVEFSAHPTPRGCRWPLDLAFEASLPLSRIDNAVVNSPVLHAGQRILWASQLCRTGTGKNGRNPRRLAGSVVGSIPMLPPPPPRPLILPPLSNRDATIVAVMGMTVVSLTAAAVAACRFPAPRGAAPEDDAATDPGPALVPYYVCNQSVAPESDRHPSPGPLPWVAVVRRMRALVAASPSDDLLIAVNARRVG